MGTGDFHQKHFRQERHTLYIAYRDKVDVFKIDFFFPGDIINVQSARQI